MESGEHTHPASLPPPGVPASAEQRYERYEQPADRPGTEGPIHPGSGRRFSLRSVGTALGVGGLLLLKFGAKLKALLFLLPKIKLFSTSATMLVSVAAYSLLW